MNRDDLLLAARKALAAADAATIAASFDRIRPERADHFTRIAEEALYAALDALAMAQLGPARADHPPATNRGTVMADRMAGEAVTEIAA